MNDPFFAQDRTVIHYSGGRTSGLMLRRTLDAHGGRLQDHVKVVFCNTGKERQETLDFVEETSQRWGVPIVWLEYRNRPVDRRRKGVTVEGREHYAVEVNHATASRRGEPFLAAIEARNFLPNQQIRFCTGELKIKTCRRYLLSMGWKEYESFVGIRADEPRRYTKLMGCNAQATRSRDLFGEEILPRRKDAKPGEHIRCPLYEARIGLSQVMDFWSAQPFDLKLEQGEGNCDLCLLKGEAILVDLMRRRPQDADWWIEQESRGIGIAESRTDHFSKRFSYTELRDAALGKVELPLFGFDMPDCHCTD